jgi:uncharacterized protein (DUF1499 family)
VARLAVAVGVASWLALGVAGPLHHLRLLGLRPTFGLIAAGLLGVIVTLVLALIALVFAARQRSGMPAAVAALALALIAIGGICVFVWTARGVPAIHDITTDTDRPPQFVAVLPLRAGALNPVEYGGPKIAAQQRKSYPDLAPLMLNVPPDRAFDRALAAARTMGWEMAGSDQAAGRIEATDTTFWFGFKDDVVIRVTPEGVGSRVDVRSLSRVGGGDVGTNAKRIRRYLAALKAAS